MNENKLSLILNKIFHIVFLFCFVCLFFSIILIGYNDKSNKYSQEERPWIVLAFLLLLAIFTAVYIFIQKYHRSIKYSRLRTKEFFTDRNIKIIIFSVVGIMLVVQLTVGYLLQMEPVSDLKNLNKYALYFAENGNFDLIQKDFNETHYAYLIRYPNNFAMVCFLSFLYRIAYLIFGYVPMYLPVAVNAVAINISVLLIVFIARKIFGNRKALMVLILSFLFTPFYTYVPYYYTDSISMPFGIGAIYLFISAIQSNSGYKKYVMIALCGALIFLGYKIKGSLILLLVVTVVFLVLKLKIKRVLCLFLALIAGFGILNFSYNTAFKSAGIITEEQSNEYEYPYTHWIMMGLKGLGLYDYDDDMYTRKFPDKQAKQEANIEEIKNRIKEYGFLGMIKHLTSKADWTWQDGTYYIALHIQNPVRKNVLHSFILDKGENQPAFFIYSCGFQLFLISMICMSVLKGCIKPDINIQTLFKGIVFAVFVFFLIWETRARYLYNFTPIFILLSVDGLDFFTEGIMQKFYKRDKSKTIYKK